MCLGMSHGGGLGQRLRGSLGHDMYRATRGWINSTRHAECVAFPISISVQATELGLPLVISLLRLPRLIRDADTREHRRSPGWRMM